MGGASARLQNHSIAVVAFLLGDLVHVVLNQDASASLSGNQAHRVPPWNLPEMKI